MPMTPAFTIYHFLPLTHPRASEDALGMLLDEGVRPVLDLEDSVGCMLDPGRNQRLKARARANLLDMARRRAVSSPSADRVLVRINQRGSAEYLADIAVLESCARLGFRPGILLSKTHGPEDVRDCSSRLVRGGAGAPRIVPILESVAGIDALESILDVLPESGRTVFFGYFDFALDAGHWPLRSQLGASYWKFYQSLSARVEAKSGSLVNAPFAHWNSEEELLRVKSMLLATATRATGMCSLGMPQTTVLARKVPAAPLPVREHEPSCLVTHARWVIRHFSAARCNMRSFAVVDGYFVTPHEYMLAQRYLEGLGKLP